MKADYYKKKQKKGATGSKAIFQYLDRGCGKYKTRTKLCEEQSTRKKNEKAADAWLDEQAAEYDESIASFDDDKITFSQYVERKKETHFHQAVWRGDVKISGYDSWDAVRRYEMQMLIEQFGAMRLKAITQHDIDVFRAKRFKTKTKDGNERTLGAVNRDCQLLRRVFSLAYKDKILRERFDFGVNNNEEEPRSRTLKGDEEQRLMLQLEKPEYARYKPMFVTLLETGMRIGELKNITWAMVKNLDQPERCHFALTARATKTKKARTVPFSERVREILLERTAHGTAADKPVFDTTNYKNDVKDIFKDAELSEFWARDTKHCAVTNMAKANVPRHLIRKIIGTETDKLLDRVYINLELEDLQEGYKKFVDYRNKPIETKESAFVN
ncbi:MAG TPA: site-specific integrase [Pyrinomonadaceae bacterium]|jgi:integrase